MNRKLLLHTVLFVLCFSGACMLSRSIVQDEGDPAVPYALPVTIDTDPSGALVFVNGSYKGTAPCTVFPDRGRAALRIVKEDYFEITRQITPDDGKRVSAVLKRIPEGLLDVISVPSGAAVFIGQTFIGKTPVTGYRLDTGIYRIKLVRANYLPRIEQAVVSEERTSVVEAALESKIETFYKTALAGDPGNIHFHAELAHYFLITDRKEEAVFQYAKGLEAAGAVAENYGEKMKEVSRLLNEIRKLQKKERDVVRKLMPAVERLVSALEKNRSIPDASLRGVARRLKMLKRRDLANRLIRRERERELGFAELRRLEEQAGKARDRGDAQEAYRIYTRLADLYEDMEGDAMKRRAVSHLREAANLQKDPRLRVKAGIRIAGLYRELGRKKEGMEVLEKVLSIMPDDMAGGKTFWNVCSDIARLRKEADGPAEARRVYEYVLKKYQTGNIQERARRELDKIKQLEK